MNRISLKVTNILGPKVDIHIRYPDFRTAMMVFLIKSFNALEFMAKSVFKRLNTYRLLPVAAAILRAGRALSGIMKFVRIRSRGPAISLLKYENPSRRAQSIMVKV